jgi:hypothetical protein
MKSRLQAVYWAVGIVLLTCVPYIVGLLLTPPGGRFMGLTHNIDDGAVYLSWIRQAAHGHFFITNLYTNEHQPHAAFNLLFLLMGLFGRIPGLSGIWVYHIFRIALSVGFLLWVPTLARLYLDEDAQKYALPLVGLSAGIGWLMPGARMPIGPVDTWQPEAITFLSMYLNPLFVAGLWLTCAAIYFLTRAEQTGRFRFAVSAGLILLVLGNVHTYDVLTVGVTWVGYVVITALLQKRVNWRLVMLSVIAAAIALPSVIYQAHVYAIDPVYRARANTPTPSAPIWSELSGYGFVAALALATAIMFLHPRIRARMSVTAESAKLLLLPGIWAVVNLLSPYLPIAQQRKLLMGAHIPLCILACAAIAVFIRRAPEPRRALVYMVGLLILSLSNIGFLAKDTALLTHNRTVTLFPPYVRGDMIRVCDYIGATAKPNDSVFADPFLSLWLPAMAGVPVYYGHWSETPHYSDRLRLSLDYFASSAGLSERRAILRKSRCDILVGLAEDTPLDSYVTGDKTPRKIGSYAVFRLR